MAALNATQLEQANQAFTPTNPNVFGVNGLSIFDSTDADGREFMAFVINKQQNFVQMTEQQVETVCLNLLRHFHEKRREAR